MSNGFYIVYQNNYNYGYRYHSSNLSPLTFLPTSKPLTQGSNSKYTNRNLSKTVSEYTFSINFEPLKANATIKTILDINALCAPAKAALAGYVTSLALPATQTQHMLWENVGLNIYIEQLTASYYLPSLGVQTPAPVIKRSSTLADKVSEISSLTGRYPKCQFLLWVRPNATAAWQWVSTDLIQNYGNRVNYLNLLIPYLTQGDVLVTGRETQIGLQFITDTTISATLPQPTDKLVIQGSVRVELSLLDAKKNNETEALKTRLTALENLLGVMGAATATAAGRNGLVPAPAIGQSSRLLRGDSTWQDPNTLPITTATTTAINSVIANLVASSPATLDTLNELAIALGNDPNFATTITTLVGAKVSKAGNETITGVKIFTGQYTAFQSTTPGFWLDESDHTVKGAYIVLDGGVLQIQRRATNFGAYESSVFSINIRSGLLTIPGFTALGEQGIGVKTKLITGVTAATQGTSVAIAHGLIGDKIVGVQVLIRQSANAAVSGSLRVVTGYEYDWYFDPASINVSNVAGNSANILSKPISVLITYIA